jgi:hypothetical protein
MACAFFSKKWLDQLSALKTDDVVTVVGELRSIGGAVGLHLAEIVHISGPAPHAEDGS